ncbi:RNA cytidine acetyltransferase [Chloropicon primus]|uniref:RNA cytidine acetyltransferase n=2 Tax=Chloropicon primus TaxID=1764295 RepID=A0A5B8MTB8_9CHLO|nr:RNA cytidine acetyltransferase [Chloropicon primus]UPR03016.1 RNA cytidine acetyltransferase [Chloropicon primus]|eukprot:QDZ23803.1 RNA cytidine acetyltransferase [Chloropicon primus]
MRKKVDARVRTLIENCVKKRERAMFVLVGDKGRDQVVNLHNMLARTVVKARPTVLWCYKKELYLSSHKRKRMKQLKKMMQRGLVDPEKEDPFSVFMASTQIRYCYYSESQNILGNTYGMCVLQDFEAINPNLLARTIETVEGGGIIVLLLSTLTSLTQVYNLSMDVHARLRTQSHQEVVGRFNERMVLSMAHNPNCILMDDELNVLPTSSLMAKIRPASGLSSSGEPAGFAGKSKELGDLCDMLADTQPAGTLVSLCKTIDQAKSLVTFLDSASEKTLRSTVALTAARGRGKSAALGLAISGALALGYSNIFVTSPSPENLKTLFEFVVKGLDSMDYKEHIDYNMIESTNPELHKVIVRVDVFRQHRQTVQYILPQHSSKIMQAELLVIDEAAAIPLPVVRSLLGPYLVFLCSTVNGYEGTGRSLSLKLLKELRGGANQAKKKYDKFSSENASIAAHSRNFREITLDEPIRYAEGDPMEGWLHELLCLDAANHVPEIPKRLPHPDECELFYISKDTLFSYHKATEKFLQQIMSLYVASHYKNTPNDILLMSDAPAHHLFVLLAPVDENTGKLPDVLCVLQVAFEGQISKSVSLNALAKGNQYHGDLIPWTVSQHFQDAEFPKLSGARVVRIATHPDITGGGYGSKALQLIKLYFEGGMQGLDDVNAPRAPGSAGGKSPAGAASESSVLLTETIAPKKGLPPLLISLEERPPETLQYLGVAFGLTSSLFNFWKKNDYHPVYIRHSASETTGENSCISIHPLDTSDIENGDWLVPFVDDFKARFLSLLSNTFHHVHTSLALAIVDPFIDFTEADTKAAVEKGVEMRKLNGQTLTPFDLKRLESFTSNLSDYHLVKDLVPSITAAYFSKQVPVQLSSGQAAILLGTGLQQKSDGSLGDLLGLPANQVRALANKALKKIYGVLKSSKEAVIDRSLPVPKMVQDLRPHEVTVDEDLNEAATEADEYMKSALSLDKVGHFAIAAEDVDLNGALKGAKIPESGTVSIKSRRSEAKDSDQPYKRKKSRKSSDGKKRKSRKSG